jgi:type IV secretory pathway ATPase VirB11/archaellum biosynthesis ATPase
MAMFRRSRKAAPPLHRKQQEIAQQEAQLREKVESLERIVTQSQAPAPKKSSVREPHRSATNNVVEKRFHISIAMDAPQVLDDDRRARRPRAMRKERRQGRIVFLILLAALGVAVMLLISHLHP